MDRHAEFWADVSGHSLSRDERRFCPEHSADRPGMDRRSSGRPIWRMALACGRHQPGAHRRHLDGVDVLVQPAARNQTRTRNGYTDSHADARSDTLTLKFAATLDKLELLFYHGVIEERFSSWAIALPFIMAATLRTCGISADVNDKLARDDVSPPTRSCVRCRDGGALRDRDLLFPVGKATEWQRWKTKTRA